jgi:drug/metabolite transporter (DMT)-like permease
MTSLAGAYRTGQMSVVYPLARSSPAVFVAVVSFAIGRERQISHQCVAGIILVVFGGFLLPMTRFRDLRVTNYLKLSGFLALAAAVGTAGYSMIDDQALRSLRDAPAMPLGAAQVTLVYSFFEGISTSFWLAAGVLGRSRGRAALGEISRGYRGTAALTGVAMYLGYTLVLISMAFVANVSYVVAFRQTSILFGAILGVLVLSEPSQPPKFAGVVLMLAGLLLIATG